MKKGEKITLTKVARARITKALKLTNYNSNRPKIIGYRMQLEHSTNPSKLSEFLNKLELSRAKLLTKEDSMPVLEFEQ